MGEIKRFSSGQRKERKAVFNGFGYKEGYLQPKESCNCDTRGGTLKWGVGLVLYKDMDGKTMSCKNVPTVIDSAAFKLEKDGVVSIEVYVIDADGYLYRRRSDGYCVKVDRMGKRLCHSVMKMENGEVYHFLSAANAVFYTKDGETLTKLASGTIRGSCICGMRFMYALKNGELHYLSPLAFSSSEGEGSNGSGVIYLPEGNGNVVGLREFGGSAYVFFEKGIYRLTPAADAREFTLTKVEFAGGTVCWGAMISTGKGVLFLATDGLYLVQDNRAEKVFKHIPIPLCDATYLCTVGRYEELFFLDFRAYEGEEVTLLRLALDMEKEDGYYLPVYGTLSEDGPAFLYGYFYTFAKDAQTIRRSTSPSYLGERLNFGTEKAKRLKKVRIKGEGNVDFCVQCGDAVGSYMLSMKDGFAESRLAERGEDFYFLLYPSKYARVDGIEVTYVVEE